MNVSKWFLEQLRCDELAIGTIRFDDDSTYVSLHSSKIGTAMKAVEKRPFNGTTMTAVIVDDHSSSRRFHEPARFTWWLLTRPSSPDGLFWSSCVAWTGHEPSSSGRSMTTMEPMPKTRPSAERDHA